MPLTNFSKLKKISVFTASPALKIWEPIAVNTLAHQPPSYNVLGHVVPPHHVDHVQPFLVVHIQGRKVGSCTEPTNCFLNETVSRQL